MGTGDVSHELRIAETILGVLPAGTWARVCADDREIIRYSVRAAGLKLTAVFFSRSSLTSLGSDASGLVKIEYLRRDLLRTAERRAEFRYPRSIRRSATPRRARRPGVSSLASLASIVS